MMDLSKHWRKVVEIMQDGLLLVDPRGRILSVNPAAERLTGYSAGELIDSPCTILNCTGCRVFGKGAGERWCDLYRSGHVRAKKCQITDKGQRPVDVVKHASVLRDEDGRILGAVETLTDISDVVHKDEEIACLKASLAWEEGFHGMIGASPEMLRLFDLIQNVAQSQAPVFIHGESGVGKELVARAIHEASPRADGPFIKVNCAALNENLLESEMFGHARGAFTGAERTRIGRFEAASGGSIFLDEIGDVPLSSQVKLLRVLEEKEIERVGDHRPIAVDVRVITATNHDLEQLIAEGRFREDLFFRINVIPLGIPPLRERLDDLTMLVQSFIARLAHRTGKQIEGMTPEAMDCLLQHPWPGNCRELQNVLEYAFVLCPHGERIRPVHLPKRILAPQKTAARVEAASSPPVRSTPQREEVIRALRSANGNRTQAAKILGVSRVTLWKRIKKYAIDPAEHVA